MGNSNISKKKRRKPTIEKIDNSYLKFKYIKFNFSFIENYNDFIKSKASIKSGIIDRLFELSTIDYLTLSQWNKKSGFEAVTPNNLGGSISNSTPRKFLSDDRFKDIPFRETKLAIFRGKVKNHEKCRIICYPSDKIFYVLYIDVDGKLYKHD